jgi:outer membrane protein TolC
MMKPSFRHYIVLGALPLFAATVLADVHAIMPEHYFPQLKEALQKLAEQSPRMISANMELALADGELTQARSGLYPSVGGLYQLTSARDRREDQPGVSLSTDKTYYNFTVTQPLFHWGEKRNSARIGEIRRQIAGRNYAEARRLLMQEVRTAYLTVVARKVQHDGAVFALKRAEDELALAEDRLAKRVVAEGEIFQIRIDAEQARLNLETATWEFASARQNFAVLTGSHEMSLADIPDVVPAVASTNGKIELLLARFLAQGEPQTDAILIQRQLIEIEELTYQNQKTRLRPKLNLVAGVSQDEQSYTINQGLKYGLQSRYVGVSVTWSIFDGFATKGAVASALARKRIAEHNYKRMTDTMLQDAKRAARLVGLAEKQLAISERLLASAAGFLEFSQGNFSRGQAAESDVAKAQAGYNVALAATNAARASYLLRISEFVSMVGAELAER